MQNRWWKLQKGTGVIVCIPGDEHHGIQSKRPGIVLKTHPEYITVQLLSTTKSNHNLGTTNINYKIQYIRPIYLRNVPHNQIIGLWYDFKKNVISINDDSKIMKLIETNPYKASSITLSLEEFLKIKDKEEQLLSWNKELQEENSKLKIQLETTKKRQRSR